MKTTNSKKMNQKWYSPGFIIPCVAGISLCVSSLSAQEESEEVYELSPFTISADDVDGYRATSTMAGTRLKSNLKDIGSSISVVTAQLFEDTGATDASTILSYTMGTEVSGANGNFSDGLGTNQNGRPTQDLQRLDPAQSQRVRGLASASLTRNFFLTDIPFDSYNTDRVEISRGANSILFGIGSPGGVINASTVLAHSDGEDFNEVSFRLGERGSHRETVDVHRVVVDGRLAVRLNLLNKDTRYKQAPAYEEDQRIYLTAEAVLFNNEGNEKIGPLRARASYENGNIEGNPPSILPPGDGFSSWWALPDASLLASVPGVKIPFYHPDAGTVDPSAVGAFEGSRIHPEFGINGWVPQQTFDTRIGFSPRKNLPAPAEQVGNWGSSVVFADPSGNT
ncbi:MAG: TonB-dependent receptor plug domain-containing protein, partial [Opitutaceae bacterium]|nr:TonB-dependent receptor plug domain-containing protein [Opitutaceae bacterium]